LDYLVVLASHPPQSSIYEKPPHAPAQSFTQSFVLSESQVPQLSAIALPPNIFKQSIVAVQLPSLALN